MFLLYRFCILHLFQANRPQLERVYRGQMRVLTDEPFVPDPGSIFHMQEIIVMMMNLIKTKMNLMVTMHHMMMNFTMVMLARTFLNWSTFRKQKSSVGESILCWLPVQSQTLTSSQRLFLKSTIFLSPIVFLLHHKTTTTTKPTTTTSSSSS